MKNGDNKINIPSTTNSNKIHSCRHYTLGRCLIIQNLVTFVNS